MNHQPKQTLLYITILIILTLLGLYLAATNLANYTPITGDDAWIMSASFKLASEGIFGSDPYTGFFNADQHYFIALPVYHFLQAASFKLMGFGVAQARLPNLFSAILLIWLTAALANRHHGRKTALLAVLLLILLCPNPLSIDPCNMLLVYARNGRYDLTATTLVWAAVWLLDTHTRHPRTRTAFALGLTAALAALTQFFGAFILLPIALIFLTHRKRPFRRHPILPFSAGFLLLAGPYLAYILAHFNDFVGQSILKGGRIDLLRPGFYLENILREPNRFQPLNNLLPSQISGILIFAASLAAVAYILHKRIHNPAQKALPIHWLSFAFFILSLALVEQTKAPVYFIILLPGICLGLSAISTRFFKYLYYLNRPFPIRLLAAAPLLLLLSFLLTKGIDSAGLLLTHSRNATNYPALGQQIESVLPSDTVILGPDRWWPPLKDRRYLALNNLWAQWKTAAADGRSPTPTFSQIAAGANIEYVFVNYNIFGSFTVQPASLETQFWDYLTTCATLHSEWEDPTYGRIQLYQVEDTPGCNTTTPTN